MFKKIEKLKKSIEEKRNSKKLFWKSTIFVKDVVWLIQERFRYRFCIALFTFKKPGQVFTEVYENNFWGGKKNEFYSGSGSHFNNVVEKYVETIISYLKKYKQNQITIVDLGCGDFNIGEKFIDYCKEYIAVDVVEKLIKKLKADDHSDRVKFLCLDIINDELPDGDVCFIRQVFQHLSNKEISRVLFKLKKYKVVFISAHYPSDDSKIIPNKDIVHGPETRRVKNSAVFLDEPPFNIPKKSIKTILEAIPDDGQGIIRTYKIEF